MNEQHDQTAEELADKIVAKIRKSIEGIEERLRLHEIDVAAQIEALERRVKDLEKKADPNR